MSPKTWSPSLPRHSQSLPPTCTPSSACALSDVAHSCTPCRRPQAPTQQALGRCRHSHTTGLPTHQHIPLRHTTHQSPCTHHTHHGHHRQRAGMYPRLVSSAYHTVSCGTDPPLLRKGRLLRSSSGRTTQILWCVAEITAAACMQPHAAQASCSCTVAPVHRHPLLSPTRFKCMRDSLADKVRCTLTSCRHMHQDALVAWNVCRALNRPSPVCGVEALSRG